MSVRKKSRGLALVMAGFAMVLGVLVAPLAMAAPAAAVFDVVEHPIISQAGLTLTVAPAELTPPATKVTYQWYRNGKVTISEPGYQPYVFEEWPANAMLADTHLPAADIGLPYTPEVTVYLATGKTSSSIHIEYQWLRNGEPIEGANELTYTPVNADHPNKRQLRITASAPKHATVTFTTDFISTDMV